VERIVALRNAGEPRLLDTLASAFPTRPGGPIGVLAGEGIGPEVVGAALRVLDAVGDARARPFDLRVGGRLSAAEAAEFCAEVFSSGGVVLAGAFGSRFVYDVRRRFDLFCKLSPIRPFPELSGAGRLRPEELDAVDILVVRETAGGIYQGTWSVGPLSGDGRLARHSFEYEERHVRRLLDIAARLAARRGGKVAVVVKRHGVPSVSDLWLDVAADVCGDLGVHSTALEVDYAAYALIQHARALDVVAAPNLFGDILSDLGGVLLGSRGLCHGASFSTDGAAVYQTNHGAAQDLAGTDRANPAGQILALAMLLRESLGAAEEAALVESALRHVWQRGWRTFDLAERGAPALGTAEFGELVAETVTVLGFGSEEAAPGRP
jgi:3-isopropylmalate dehydrogenase